MQHHIVTPSRPSRREFLKTAFTRGLCMGIGGLLCRSPPVALAKTSLTTVAPLHPALESLVRLLVDTPPDRLLQDLGQRVRDGITRQALSTALLLAGVRHIQPRPVGYKFHAVMVIHPAYRASTASPEADRWLPLFWAVDDFKHAQYWNARQGDWTMAPIKSAIVPPPHRAKAAFMQAMEQWDEAAADAAVVGLARAAEPRDVFNLLCRYGTRDLRDIGHKTIHLANTWRMLHTIGWQHAEPVLRSLAYAFLAHEGPNPAQRDAPADRPFRRNQALVAKLRNDWQHGHHDATATADLLATLRQADDRDACDAVVATLSRGIAPQAIWDALLLSAAELLMRQPGILALHAVTTTHAMHAAYQITNDDLTRRLILLQNAAFLPLFRSQPNSPELKRIDHLQPLALKRTGPDFLEDIFADINANPARAASKTFAYLQGGQSTDAFMKTALRFMLHKGSNAHDYKFTMAVLEDFRHISPAWRNRYLAANVVSLRGSADSGNPLVQRIRSAVEG